MKSVFVNWKITSLHLFFRQEKFTHTPDDFVLNCLHTEVIEHRVISADQLTEFDQVVLGEENIISVHFGGGDPHSSHGHSELSYSSSLGKHQA